MIPALTLDALRVLDAIDRRQSFAAAADELYRVPSAVSYSVNKLEEDLGVELFDRSRRRAQLTPVGRLVLEEGRRILLAADELAVLARQAAEGWETRLRICIDSILSPEDVFALVEEFQQLQPRTEVRLTEEVLGGTWDALNDDRCDLVIGAEGAPPGPGFGLHPLGQVVFEFAVARDHPLTLQPQPLSERAIADYPTVVVADSSRQLPGRSSGLLDGRGRLVVASIEQKIEAQCRGLGVGYLPRHRILRHLDAGRLQVLALESPRAASEIAVAWRRQGMGKGLQWLVARLRSARFDPDIGLLLAPA